MNRIRTFIKYQTTDKPWGGSNSFLSALKSYLSTSNDVEIVSNENDAFDLLFLNSAYVAPGRYVSLKEVKKYHEYGYGSFLQFFLKRLKKRSIKIILRLDGLRRFYTETTSNKGDSLQLDLLKFADAIIFQSNESVRQFKEVLGDISTQYFVINNAVSQNVFNFKNKSFWNKKEKLKIFATSWSTNPIKGFDEMVRLSQIDGVSVNFVGNWPKSIHTGKVHLAPPLPQKLLAEEYKKNDVFFFPAQNEACPNVVYEAR